MAHVVTLSEEDQILLLNQLAANWEYKALKKLRNEHSIRAMSEYYIDACEKIRDNHIPVNHSTKNFFSWMMDQLKHGSSRQWKSDNCQRAIEICEAARTNRYNQLRLRRASQRLFEESL